MKGEVASSGMMFIQSSMDIRRLVQNMIPFLYKIKKVCSRYGNSIH
jgi:hypothetical protein